MKRFLALTLSLAIIAGSAGIPQADAAVSNWQKGASFQPRWDRDFESEQFKQSVVQLKNMGAEYVSLVIPYYQSNLYSTDIQAGWNTPPFETIRTAIDYIHSQGMKVSLKPHLESHTGEWRAYINPGDRDGWFQNYGTVLENLAKIGRDHGAEQIVIGTELISMSTATSDGRNTQAWRDLIGRVRAVYSGKLTYSANWGGFWFADEKNHIEFWDALDYIGISGYFGLGDDGSVQAMKNAWNNWNWSDIKPLADRWGKQIMFTEVGYKSVSGAHREPWNSGYGGSADEWEQHRDYEALLSYWNDYGYLGGITIWDWEGDPNAGGNWTTGYTPQNKIAYNLIKDWFSSPALPNTGGDTGGNPQQTESFTAAATISPELPTAGTAATISTTISHASDSNISGLLVDVEVYDGSGAKIFQQVFENQSFNGRESKTLTSNWTPSSAGTYTIKAGVFHSSWSPNHFWADNLRQVPVQQASGGNTGGGTTPTDSNVAVDIWWPTEGAFVSGRQPVKAMLSDDRPLDTYEMYWQVDGGTLNPMANGYEGYPHKEATIDYFGWNWKGEGPYTINIAAKKPTGETIKEKAVSIKVAQ